MRVLDCQIVLDGETRARIREAALLHSNAQKWMEQGLLFRDLVFLRGIWK